MIRPVLHAAVKDGAERRIIADARVKIIDEA
jgi:hypothetical protein